ncbi:hypothetical protein NBRC3188_3233 [Acetobacter pasteurianus NBRC 3188]|uniref:Uncharacterized protein n=1 Tax=Acetobacter pasteurianus NBRC 3188 TaxID=1226663 RepID=A0A401WYZ9_ACEPA|nr:hypothetical protein NBRC3188_3233 [Acetobacter pasteurianus NBRC 3188]
MTVLHSFTADVEAMRHGEVGIYLVDKLGN